MDDSIGSSSSNAITSKHIAVGAAEPEEGVQTKQIKENLHKYEQLFGVDEDSFDQPTTSRKELWSYYLYYNASLHSSWA